MSTTRDYLQEDPWVAVVNRINDLYLTEIQPNTSSLKAIESLGGTRTKITIETNISEAEGNTMPPVTRYDYEYDRLDLASFFRVTTPKGLTGFALPTSTFKVIDAISELNDIKFTLNDFMHYQYDEYLKVYTLEANPKSLRFVGSLQFELVNTTKQLLANVGNKVEFPVANTWPIGNDGTKAVGQYMLSGLDFTDEREFIKSLDSQSIWPSGRKLAAILENVSGYPWVCSGTSSKWNIAYENKLGDAAFNVIYNGAVLPRYTSRTDIQRVLVLRLGDLSSNVSGYLLIHYN